jgi:hypothetical protein
MKKLLVGALALISTFAFTSCEKRWTCRCTFNGEEVYSKETSRMSRDEAKNQCNTNETSVLGQTWDCDLY